jgi:hypothetical protein
MNPYSAKSEAELEQIYERVNPNKDIMSRRQLDLKTRSIWKNQNPAPTEVESFKKEISDYLDELISYQDGLSAAIVAVNRQNSEMFRYLNK